MLGIRTLSDVPKVVLVFVIHVLYCTRISYSTCMVHTIIRIPDPYGIAIRTRMVRTVRVRYDNPYRKGIIKLAVDDELKVSSISQARY